VEGIADRFRRFAEVLVSFEQEDRARAALAAAAPDGGLTPENATLAIVGVDTPFTLLEGDDLAPYLAAIGDDAGGGGNEGGGDAAAGDAPAPMVD
jgi:hypothetical protein